MTILETAGLYIAYTGGALLTIIIILWAKWQEDKSREDREDR